MSSTALLLGALAVSGSKGVVNRDDVLLPTEVIVASLPNETREAYRRFTDTFAETESGAAGQPVPAAEPPEPAGCAPGAKTSSGSWQSVSWVEEGNHDDVPIRDLLERYSAALTARSVDQVAVLQPGLSDAALQKLADYFELARDLTVQISEVDVLREGDEAIATFRRRDEFTDQKSGRRFTLEAIRSATLRKVPGDGWKLVAFGE